MAVGSISLLTLKTLKPIFLMLSLLLFTYDQLLKENGTTHEEEFSYEVGTPNGPENWGSLRKEWRLCGTGLSQSPINIQSDETQLKLSVRNLKTYYQPAQATLTNRGHDVEMRWNGDAGSIVIGGCEYNVIQSHWHIPSEHTVNGKRYEMELHIVHNNTQGNIAVIGILYKLGAPDPFLARLVPYLQSVDAAGKKIVVGNLNPDEIGFDISNYYRYNGSLTTPPCSENVTWTVIRKVETLSKTQLTALKKAVSNDSPVNNARPLQKLNGRTVYMYRQFFQESAESFSSI